MATSQQATLGEFGVHHYERGDLLRDTGTGRATRLMLTECPFCASDPHRPRYHFSEQESRADHIASVHGQKDST
ncbi:hypothetical protein OSG_eHP27_00085 [environmental Halophage eHP-27]|nr:hypothetical protein OSG_eHP27_00085 [environmental Halophage eHP-27]